jgi:hypothetical protein
MITLLYANDNVQLRFFPYRIGASYGGSKSNYYLFIYFVFWNSKNMETDFLNGRIYMLYRPIWGGEKSQILFKARLTTFRYPLVSMLKT